MGFEINKIIVAVLVTILVVFFIGSISDLIFKTEKNHCPRQEVALIMKI